MLKALKAVIYGGKVPRLSEPSVSALPETFLLVGGEGGSGWTLAFICGPLMFTTWN